MNRKLIAITLLSLLVLLGACTAKDTVSQNISRDADEFRVVRRVVFYNSITDTYMMEMVGNIAIDIDRDGVLEVIAKIGPDEYQKHYLGLSDNVTYTVEQIGTVDASLAATRPESCCARWSGNPGIQFTGIGCGSCCGCCDRCALPAV